mmetsp:Transcript_51570/g.102444  ORF Transcript_51570/g.102444 Transcript_51570/m.102444 type:complete len:258 (+) Transcript_51570:162-935(+)
MGHLQLVDDMEFEGVIRLHHVQAITSQVGTGWRKVELVATVRIWCDAVKLVTLAAATGTLPSRDGISGPLRAPGVRANRSSLCFDPLSVIGIITVLCPGPFARKLHVASLEARLSQARHAAVMAVRDLAQAVRIATTMVRTNCPRRLHHRPCLPLRDRNRREFDVPCIIISVLAAIWFLQVPTRTVALLAVVIGSCAWCTPWILAQEVVPIEEERSHAVRNLLLSPRDPRFVTEPESVSLQPVRAGASRPSWLRAAH